jgi:poly-gamma-glutamate capsule biosynthesis protein CapA/YwtB (metallophosphatase superfamily)
LQGIEIYRGCPIFYDLGSIVFHTRTKTGYYPPEVWESVVADCGFAGGKLVSMDLTPVVLNENGLSQDTFFETRGRPSIARGDAARRVLTRLQHLSPGVEISMAGEVGRIVI